MFADLEHVSVLQDLAAHANAVDERAVRALQVFDSQEPAVVEQARVMARHGRAVDDDRVVSLAADGRHPSNRVFLQHSVLKL